MADVRINGKRVPPLQSIDTLSNLLTKLDAIAEKNNSAVTALSINNSAIDLENPDFYRLKLEVEDTIDVKLDTPQQLSYESLQVAIDMAELLINDLKVVTLQLWESGKDYEKSLEMLLHDCNLFLSLGARPIYLLNKDPEQLESNAQLFLRQLDLIANHVEDATLLAVHDQPKDACYILVGMIKPAIEQWIGMSAQFAQILDINNVSDTLVIS